MEAENKNIIKPEAFVWGDTSTTPYWKRNLIPVFLEIGFLISCFTLPQNYIIYSKFIFYTALFIYLLIIKSFSFHTLWRNMKSSFHFWRLTITCGLFFCLAFSLTDLVEQLFPKIHAGYFNLNVNDVPTIILFSIITLFLAPIVEETFFRGTLISMETKSLMILTSVASIFLFAIAHSFTLWGIIAVAIWAIPLTITFLKTRNYYITITAHFIVNLIINIPIIISFIAK